MSSDPPGQESNIRNDALHGFERESVRVNAEGSLSTTPHPKSLGQSLTHPYITTDFAESQLEFRTSPCTSLNDSIDHLRQIHKFASARLDNEWLWPFSMPPRLPIDESRIPLAAYGDSREGQEKTIYRRGLSHRYGRRRYTLSGVHYNFSASAIRMAQLLVPSQGVAPRELVSDVYFHCMRNLYRHMPFLTYLFGASPAFDRSYTAPASDRLKAHKSSTLYGEFATSLRLSEMGYTSEVQDRLPMSYNSLEQFSLNLTSALTTCNPDYLAFSDDGGTQLNANYLQSEQELYALFRPKQHTVQGETLLDAPLRSGVAYMETRLLDIDPGYPEGVDPFAPAFVHMLILNSLTKPSPPLDKQETCELRDTHRNIVWRGREKGLVVQINGKLSGFHDQGRRFCESLQPVAEEMDREGGTDLYQESLKRQQAKWESPELTPSGRHLAQLLDCDQEFVDFGITTARLHAEALQSIESDTQFQFEIERHTNQSPGSH
ncbi:MAG: glutamate--cysteine ligase [Candidatus Hydrogenedentota bacterium]